MSSIVRAYDRFVVLLAVFSGVILATLFVTIVYDVVVRTLGSQPPQFTSALTEIGLVYITLLVAPWLVREKGHVAISSVRMALPPPARRVLEKLVYGLCIVLSLVLCYYALDLTITAYLRGEIDIRAVEMPLWLRFAPLPLGFFLIAIEFSRYLFGRGSYYEGEAGSQGGL